MMWLGVYQSARCWLLSGPLTVADPQLDRAAGADGRPAHPQQDQRRDRDQSEGGDTNICAG